MTLLYVLYGQLAPSLRPYRLLRFAHVRLHTIRDIAAVMAPPAVQNTAAFSIFLVYQTLIGRLGTHYLAVTALLFSLFRINKTLVGGFAQGASILVGNSFGGGNRDHGRTVILAQEVIALGIAGTVATCPGAQ